MSQVEKKNIREGWTGCATLLDYYNLPRGKKQKFLQTEEAGELINSLPPEIREVLIEAFLSGIPGSNMEGWDKVLKYFTANSSIVQEVAENPGTFSMLERMYTSKGIEGNIDNYFKRSKSGGQALKNRLDTIIDYSIEFLSKNLNGKGLVLNLGSGSGRDTMAMCLKSPSLISKVKIHCIDIDPKAIAVGRDLSESYGLSNIEFVQESLAGLGDRYPANADYGLLVGILCGLEPVLCVKVLRTIKPYFKKGAQIVAARLTDEMLKEDLFCAYISKEMTGWVLQYPCFGELKAIFEKAGYQWGGSFSEEPTRFYEIGIGIV